MRRPGEKSLGGAHLTVARDEPTFRQAGVPQEVTVPFGQPFTRRDFVRAAGLVAAGLAGASGVSASERLLTVTGITGPDPEVPNEEIARILKELFGDRPIRSGNKSNISLDMPAVAEDGRVVPVIIESNLPMTPENFVKGVHLIVDHNPDPHLAAFHLTPALGSVSIQTRIKMKRTTWVRAILETSTGDVWADYARVNVTLNGCG
jgi:predicted secreted protein